ncbi:MAG: acyl-CoA reductase, partial [Chitinophagaceae bacterium]
NILGQHLLSDSPTLVAAKQSAFLNNNWFTGDFVDLAFRQISTQYLKKEKLENWAGNYDTRDNFSGKRIGVVMAGNIPLVGLHDLICCFIMGHKCVAKLSSKDTVLMQYVISYLAEIAPETSKYMEVSTLLKDCDAYIATGSNNTARYFEYYFSKYPNIIRKNRTSVAILSGKETEEELSLLSDDVHQYFGLGCRNVTKIHVPEDYDFVALLRSFNKYASFADHHKYKNNYDYQLSIQLLNHGYYMTNESTLLFENPSNYSAISVLNYSFYNTGDWPNAAENTDEIQCIVSHKDMPFGQAQCPGLSDYADGVDTMSFLERI